MDLKLNGETVLVVGASEGIGFETARLLLEEGARVLMTSRSGDKLAAAAEALHAQTGQAVEYVSADIRKAEDVEALRAWVESRTGHLDALVTAVGGSHRSLFVDLSDADWLASYELNLLGNIRVIRAFRPLLAQAEAGRIVTLGAAAARMPYAHQIVSNVHKAGMLSLVKTLALELAEDGVRINSVCPGRSLTPLWTNRADRMAAEEGVDRDTIIARFSQEIPLKRFAEAVEQARVVVFMASQMSSYMTGQSVNVDGGIARSLT